jgi:predicted TIM-barrel fold metal-dependent hydrolase
VVFGSGTPEYIPAVELENLRDVFTDSADREKICSKTIRQVFRGRLPA